MSEPHGSGPPDAGRGPIHEYADGEVSTYAGSVNRWLLVVYALLAVWAVYYLLAYWSAE
jgi:hypothetical protein